MIIQKIDFKELDKQEIFTALHPAIEILLFGVISRKKIYDQNKVDEIRSDVYMHLWQLIVRDKIDFTRDPRQLLVFIMDITLTVGRFFQKKIIYSEEIDIDTPEYTCCITEAECLSDKTTVAICIKQEIAIWEYFYQQVLQRELTERLKLMIKRRAIYRSYSLYKEI